MFVWPECKKEICIALYCIVVTNKTFLKFHTFEIKTELPCCLTHYFALTPMWRKSSTLTPLESTSIFIRCMTKTEVHCVHGWGYGPRVPYRETNCLYPNIIHIIFITLTNLHNSNTDVGRARFGLAPRRWTIPGLTSHPRSSHRRSRAVCAGSVLNHTYVWLWKLAM